MILLSFDIEEFDVPKEKGLDISIEDSISISQIGFNKILKILKENNVRATLFCTYNFIKHSKKLIQKAINDGHEIASHGVDHWTPNKQDAKVSKDKIEELLNIKINGYRQPRMFNVNQNLLKDSGYQYNSSLNPAFIPGKYMHLNMPRTAFKQNGLLQIPASVTPHLRIPMFWLSLHNFPLFLYKNFINKILQKDGYFMTYFHPWEFVDHPHNIQKYLLPIVNRNNGTSMCCRLDEIIKFLKNKGEEFITFSEFMISYQ